MIIEAEKFKLELTHDELWDLAFDARGYIIACLKEHWVNHQNTWKENNMERLERCRRMFNALGRNDLYDEIFIKASKIFDEHNKTNKQ